MTTRQPSASTILNTYVLHSWYYMTQSHTQQSLSMCMPPCRSCISPHSTKNSSPDILSEVLAACTLHRVHVLLSPENRSTLKLRPSTFLFQRVLFSQKHTYLLMPQYTWLCKKHRRSISVQEEGLMNKGRYHLLLLHRQGHDKRGIAKSLHAYINRARLHVRWP